MKLSGAQIIMKVLEEEGVDTIFGYPGGAIIDIYDELEKTKIQHVLVRHEQAAIHAADAYARAKGKTGVCLVTSGPGATNTVTGIASAYLDSIPVVILTGQVPTALIGNDAFQEVDIVGITRPCTKHNYLVKDVKDLARILKEAFYLARTGRPGPVLVDLPKDIVKALATYKPNAKVQMISYNPTVMPNIKQLENAIELIEQAKKPLIFAGGGIISAKASQDLTKFAQKWKIPLTASLMGLGCFPASDPLWLGMAGHHGTFTSNMAIGECDLLIAVGTRFDDRITGRTDKFAQNAKIIHIDIDPTSIRKNVPVTLPIVGDCKKSLEALNKLSKTANASKRTSTVKKWLEQIDSWKDQNPLSYVQGPKVIKPQFVIEALHKLTKGDAIITTEVGQNQMWAAQFYPFEKPNHFITSGGLGVMGFGLPAAMGAQMAQPNKTVVNIAGDGSIQMNIQEISTLMQYKLPVKVVILNNGYLGMVRQWQQLFYEKRYCSTKLECTPDFVKLAEAYGAKGFRTASPKEVESVLKQGLKTKGPVFMEFMVEPEECVYPMVPAGAGITEMLLT